MKRRVFHSYIGKIFGGFFFNCVSIAYIFAFDALSAFFAVIFTPVTALISCISGHKEHDSFDFIEWSF
jgi:hypothetical protein